MHLEGNGGCMHAWMADGEAYPEHSPLEPRLGRRALLRPHPAPARSLRDGSADLLPRMDAHAAAGRAFAVQASRPSPANTPTHATHSHAQETYTFNLSAGEKIGHVLYMKGVKWTFEKITHLLDVAPRRHGPMHRGDRRHLTVPVGRIPSRVSDLSAVEFDAALAETCTNGKRGL